MGSFLLETISELYALAKENHIFPGFSPLGIYFDAPTKKSASKLKSEIAVPIIKGTPKPSVRIGVKAFPAMKVAVYKHKAPASKYQESYAKLSEWIEENGYEWTGPPIEVYTKKPKVIDGETIIYTHIQAPGRKRAAKKRTK